MKPTLTPPVTSSVHQISTSLRHNHFHTPRVSSQPPLKKGTELVTASCAALARGVRLTVLGSGARPASCHLHPSQRSLLATDEHGKNNFRPNLSTLHVILLVYRGQISRQVLQQIPYASGWIIDKTATQEEPFGGRLAAL